MISFFTSQKLPLDGENVPLTEKPLFSTAVIMVLSKRWERSFMKVRIELDPSMDEPEILIRAPRLTPELTQLQERILEQKVAPLAFYKDRSEYFLDVASILFFETDGEKIFGHTKDEAYEVKQKLYELEELLPIAFCRISKSTIVNAKQIYSLEKSFSGTSTVNFYQTHKQVHVSRRYYQLLKERLNEMR